MNKYITALSGIAEAPSRVIIGLMSGTSLDGLDIALCEFKGQGTGTKVNVLHFTTVPYQEDFKEQLKAISFKATADLEQVTLLNAIIGTTSARFIREALEGWNFPVSAVDLIASHGQTIFHAPSSMHEDKSRPNATLQIGDGDHIAVKTGIITLSDFRQKHIAAGGEGAPLAVYGDYILFTSPSENRVLLNIGGISNFTFLPAGRKPEEVFSTDAGPGNTLMDQYVQLNYPGTYYDKDALLAQSGTPNENLIDALLDNRFFSSSFPRTTGPELFNLSYLYAAQKISGQEHLQPEDVLASLCEFTARSIVTAIRTAVSTSDFQLYLSGGGMHNPLLLRKITAALGQSVKDTGALGVHPDAKEAVLFALLANECVAGGESSESGRSGFGGRSGIPNVTMGKISLPG